MKPGFAARPVAERVLEKVERRGPDECWAWNAFHDPRGYGQFNVVVDGRKTTARAHRLVYELLVGAIPEGLELDHLCRNHGCVNPAHLEPVTHAENMRRGLAGAWQRAKTNCKFGHPLTYFKSEGRRGCRICRADSSRRYRLRRQPG